MADVKLFLSCVTDEFGDDRDELRHALTRPNVEIKIQEEFQAMGGDTLALLETYVESCDVVVHFIGDMSGSTPKPSSVDDLLKRRPELAARLAEKGMDRAAVGRLTYTQWEAWLAIGFNKDGAKKNLVIVAPAIGLKRSLAFAPTDDTRASQADHLKWLRAINFYPAKPFTSADNLVARVFGSAVLDALTKAAGSNTKPRNLPFASLGDLFAGRDEDLADLHTALLEAKGAPVALHGLGGIGKTRLAIEYAWSRETVYSARLFVSASDGATLNAGLAALTAYENFDLPEKEDRDDATKITAVLRWLESNPTWLMILDNVDDRAAVAEVAKLMPRLKGGHVVITARASNFPAFVRKLEVSTLNENAAAQFLLDRTEADRSKSKDDSALALTLARELGGLALGLEQAGAQIATDRIGFARYLKLWSEGREKALVGPDATVTGTERTLATTWATSVARLSPESRRLLDRVAFLAPDPVPDSLLDVAVPGEAPDYDAYEARAGLYAYSLVSRVTAEDGGASGFVVHRLVQDFARGAMNAERYAQALREALEWLNAAFIGDPDDVRNWPVLDPLAPHALTVARTADEAEIANPTAKLMRLLGDLLYEKARLEEAEPLYRRALASDEESFGPDHPDVATDLINLASLLRATARTSQALPLYERATEIDSARYGPDHPKVARDLGHLAKLFGDVGYFVEAERLERRALEIDEASYGSNHPSVADRLHNLSYTLALMKRFGEAESLSRRSLAIDEKSLGPTHPKVAAGLKGLAGCLYQTKRPGEAIPLCERALAIDQAAYGPNHPIIGNGLNNLAVFLTDVGRLDEAQPIYQRALQILKQSLGGDHPNTLATEASLTRLEVALDRESSNKRTNNHSKSMAFSTLLAQLEAIKRARKCRRGPRGGIHLPSDFIDHRQEGQERAAVVSVGSGR